MKAFISFDILCVGLLVVLFTKMWRGVRFSTTSIAAAEQVIIAPVLHAHGNLYTLERLFLGVVELFFLLQATAP